LAKANDGAPGIDGVTFEAVEAGGVEEFLDQLREELVQRTYRPQRARKVEIPKGGGKMRQLSIPSIRERVVQGSLKLILEPIFEADVFFFDTLSNAERRDLADQGRGRASPTATGSNL
jgi:RNA-directed DNA polymerase